MERDIQMTYDELQNFKNLLQQGADLQKQTEKFNQDLTIFYSDCMLRLEVENRKHDYNYPHGDNVLYVNFGYSPNANNLALSKSNNGTNKKGVFENPLEKEIKEMLIELEIGGSPRTRKNGLLELRTAKYGSVYCRTKEEIKEKLQQKIRDEKSHVKTAPKKKKQKFPSLSEFYEKNYLPYKKNDNLAKSTLQGIEYNLSFILHNGFDKPLNEYNASDITGFLYSISKTRKRQIIQGLLNNIFTYALSLNVIEKNPCATVVKMKHDKNEGTAFSFDEQKNFFETLFADEETPYLHKCYLIFVYLTGTRRNEALSANTADIDPRQNSLHINGTKTDGSDRHIPLFPLVKKLLNTLIPKNERYFPFSQYIADTVFKKFSKAHRLHDLRHTFGTIQICVNKLDAKTVSLYMGHSTIQTTLTIYTHPEQLDRGTFLNGNLSETEKVEILRQKYNEILALIDNFLK